MVKYKKDYKINRARIKRKALYFKLLRPMRCLTEESITRCATFRSEYLEAKPYTGETRHTFLSERVDMVIEDKIKESKETIQRNF